ncbi:response regulator transcription factor [Paenibacillus glacialis]|uniref:AraC family transcriptional regulator n=1 Tax=Paenibacillus glacialis TaxID=494026 RepID=A0A168KQC8_9BACL|nr:response regulator [Paenibacillus glacialis]OAB42325.1 AraC family transcriptional regulator [Paenibacillus glacialis]
MKVLIVDDEVIIRTGLSTVINWEDSGFTVLEPAASAEEALQRIPNEWPEIIFTDIRMSGKSGLQMVHEVKKEYPDMEMIIISGFDDFAYAQQALREGASDYLLKTSRPDEIIQAALRAKQRLEHRRHEYEQVKAKEIVVNRSFLRQLLASASNPNEQIVTELWNRYPALRVKKGEQLLQMWIITAQDEDLEEVRDPEVLHAALGQMLTGLLPCEWLHWNQSLLLLVKIEVDNNGWDPVEWAIRKAEEALHFQIFAACGRSVEDAYQLREAMNTAVEASSYVWLLSHERSVRYEEIEERKGLRMVCTMEEETTLFTLLRAGNMEDLHVGIKNILERSKQDVQATPNSVQAYLHSLIMAGYRWLERAASSIGYSNVLPHGEDVNKLELAKRPEQALMYHFEAMMKQYSLIVSGTSPVQRALEYIQDNLDQSPSLSQVAKHVHMNPNYFSEVFKRETGQNYIEFITQAKLRKAMVMLSETPAKISEVANRIGYEDIKHFNRLFKKFTGQTPSEYRGKI